MSQRSVGPLVIVALFVGSAVGAGVVLSVGGPPVGDAVEPEGPFPGLPTVDEDDGELNVRTFENRSAFRSYVRAGSRLAGASGSGRPAVRQATTDAAVEVEQSDAVAMEATASSGGGDAGGSSAGSAPERIANTNVQMAGLDEPDVVKTDGRNFYYAPNRRQPVGIEPRPVEPGRPVIEDGRPIQSDVVEPTPPRERPQTHVIDASDPSAPEAVAAINTTGKLLQTGDRLVVFENREIAGYDISDPSDPREVWSKPLNGSLVTARERNGTVYVVTQTPVSGDEPCPVEPLGPDEAVACSNIHRPEAQIPVDATYSAFSLDAADGSVGDSASFVGTARNTVVYMSPDALYLTYTKPTSRAALVGEFLREEFDRTPERLADRIAEIQSYDISPGSKTEEIRLAFERWVRSLPPEKQQTVRHEFRNGFREYRGENQRELVETGIVRVGVSGSDLAVESTGTVPGRPLDQFSMDAHTGTLRITTTVPAAGSANSENDLYVLAADSLQQRGSVQGMGVTERVYSVRYVDDTAYVVTFRRVDPFHVVDLSDPENPREVGKLKLPGFSSYLHPVDDDHVLGVGEEDGRVKTVLFDVSDPANPTIADDEILSAGWSAVSESHHAFLMDRKHGVFVLPAGQQSVVMDYTNESLSVEKRISTDARATRTRFVEDSLYVFAGEAVTVVDERSWDRTMTLFLDE